MKQWILILCFAVLFYVGEDRGQFVSGVQGELRAGDFILEADNRAYLQSFKKGSFQPKEILFRFGVGYKSIRIIHDCYHSIDEDKDIKDVPWKATYVKINI